MTLKELIEKVREIDADAAIYLEKEAPKLNSYAHYHKKSDCVDLSCLFAWRETPHGKIFWTNIDKQIGQ